MRTCESCGRELRAPSGTPDDEFDCPFCGAAASNARRASRAAGAQPAQDGAAPNAATNSAASNSAASNSAGLPAAAAHPPPVGVESSGGTGAASGLVLLLGIGVAAFFLIGLVSLYLSISYSPAPAPTLVPPSPPAAGLHERLSTYVDQCFEPLAWDVLASRERYRRWVDDTEGPSAAAPHVEGLAPIPATRFCVDASRTMSGRPVAAGEDLATARTLDAAANRLARRMEEVEGVANDLEGYYREGRYRHDAMSYGRSQHLPLLTSFADVDAALAEFSRAADAVFVVLYPADAAHGATVDALVRARALAQRVRAAWELPSSLDASALRDDVASLNEARAALPLRPTALTDGLSHFAEAVLEFAARADELRAPEPERSETTPAWAGSAGRMAAAVLWTFRSEVVPAARAEGVPLRAVLPVVPTKMPTEMPTGVLPATPLPTPPSG